MQRALTKYLAQHAVVTMEPASAIANAIPWSVEHLLVIPAFAESSQLARRWSQLKGNQQLVLVVINCPDDADAPQRQQTARCLRALTRCGKLLLEASTSLPVTLVQTQADQCLAIVDARKGCFAFTPQSGVGFARRLGADIGLQLMSLGACRTHWVHSSDADAQLPEDYFTARPDATPGEIAAIIYPFSHQSNSTRSTRLTASLYDMSLRYYVLGLAWSGSPWAYHTLGSTLAIDAYHYAMNRGFPLRSAGEDYYLLNKLAKTGPILQLAQPEIRLSDRASTRVPFGTGPAVRRLAGLNSLANDMQLYHPDLFTELADWHAQMPSLYHEGSRSQLQSTRCGKVLLNMGFDQALHHCQRQARDANDFNYRLWQWFDAFRTLKTLHALRERDIPSITLAEWCERLMAGHIPFLSTPPESNAGNLSLDAIIDQLSKQDKARLPCRRGLSKLS